MNSKFSLFMQIFHNLHDKYFPLTRFKIKNNGSFKPRISRAIKNSIKRKNALYKIYIKEKSSILKVQLHNKYN